MNPMTKLQFLFLIYQEVIPAIDSTKPVTIVLYAAKTVNVLFQCPKVFLSGDILKNTMRVKYHQEVLQYIMTGMSC